jgi:cell division protein FtsX
MYAEKEKSWRRRKKAIRIILNIIGFIFFLCFLIIVFIGVTYTIKLIKIF